MPPPREVETLSNTRIVNFSNYSQRSLCSHRGTGTLGGGISGITTLLLPGPSSPVIATAHDTVPALPIRPHLIFYPPTSHSPSTSIRYTSRERRTDARVSRGTNLSPGRRHIRRIDNGYPGSIFSSPATFPEQSTHRPRKIPSS